MFAPLKSVPEDSCVSSEIPDRDQITLPSTRNIEKLLSSLGIKDHRISYPNKTVTLSSRQDLMRVMINLSPFESSTKQNLCLCESSDASLLYVGSWQFEVRGKV